MKNSKHLINQLDLLTLSSKLEVIIKEIAYHAETFNYEDLLNEMQEQASMSDDFENLGPETIKNSIKMFNLLRKSTNQITELVNTINNSDKEIYLNFCFDDKNKV